MMGSRRAGCAARVLYVRRTKIVAKSARRKKPAGARSRQLKRLHTNTRARLLTASQLSHRHDTRRMNEKLEWLLSHCCGDKILVVLDGREDGVDDSCDRQGWLDDSEEEVIRRGEDIGAGVEGVTKRTSARGTGRLGRGP